jgi:PPOX class probable F420-dependent enzyme
VYTVKLTGEESRERARGEAVAHLATLSGGGQPHLVPVTFVIAAGRLAIGIDEKPKSTLDLKRLRNIHENPRVAVLWDRYDDDWSELWWVRADGDASIEAEGPTWGEAWAALNEKYPQYEGRQHSGPVILIDVTRWSGWAYG